MHFLDYLEEKSAAEYAADFTITSDTNYIDRIAATFLVDKDQYSVIVYRSNKKGLWKVAIGLLPGKNLRLWKVKPSHLRVVIGTAVSVIDHAVSETSPTLLAGIAIRLPDATKPSHIALLPRLIQRKYASVLKWVPVAPPKDSDEKEIYALIARKTANTNNVFSGKDFVGYDFDPKVPTAPVPFEALKDAESRKPLRLNNVSREPLIVKGFEVSFDDESMYDTAVKEIKSTAQIVKSVKKKDGLAIGFVENLMQQFVDAKDYSAEALDKYLAKVFAIKHKPDPEFIKQYDSFPLDYEYSWRSLTRAEINVLFKNFNNIGDIYIQLCNTLPGPFMIDKIHTSKIYDNDYHTAARLLSDGGLGYLIKNSQGHSFSDLIKNLDTEKEHKEYEEKILKLEPDELLTNKYIAATRSFNQDKVDYYDLSSSQFKIFIKLIADQQYKIADGTLIDDVYYYTSDKNIIEQVRLIVVNIVKELSSKNPNINGTSLKGVGEKALTAFTKFLKKISTPKSAVKNSIHLIGVFKLYDKDVREYDLKTNSPIVTSKQVIIENPIEVNLDEMYNKPLLDLMGNGSVGYSEKHVLNGDIVLEKHHDSKEFSRINDISHGNVYDYTGSGYEYTNGCLRVALEAFQENKDDIDSSDSNIGRALSMMQAFKEVPPLKEDVVVWRGSRWPDASYDLDPAEPLVDPGFLSTSTNPGTTSSFGGSSGGIRMMIVLPKGSKALFVNGSSAHESEKEVILPAFSILRIIEMSEVQGTRFLKLIYVGNGMASLQTKLEAIYLGKKNKPYNYEVHHGDQNASVIKLEPGDPKDAKWQELVRAGVYWIAIDLIVDTYNVSTKTAQKVIDKWGTENVKGYEKQW